MVDVSAPKTLAELLPLKKELVINAVEAAGVDVSAWSVKADGEPAFRASTNPQYCYEWCFGGEGEPTVLCLWYDSFVERDDGRIEKAGNLRALANSLQAIAGEGEGSEERSRAHDQAPRALALDSAIRSAWRSREKVRVIVNVGKTGKPGKVAPKSGAGHDSASVSKRRLDPVPWLVVRYDEATGDQPPWRIPRGSRLARQRAAEHAPLWDASLAGNVRNVMPCAIDAPARCLHVLAALVPS